jgi:hypothetical protein
MATKVTPGPRQQETRNIGISQVIAKDYVRRNVFPDLSPEKALRNFPDQSIHAVNRSMACMLIDDAVARRGERDKPRGLSLAYTCFIRQLACTFKWPAYSAYAHTPTDAEIEALQPEVDAMLAKLGIPPAKESTVAPGRAGRVGQ